MAYPFISLRKRFLFDDFIVNDNNVEKFIEKRIV